MSAVFVFLFGASAYAQPAQATSATAQAWTSPSSIRWMVARSAVDTIDTYVGSTTLTTNTFDNPRTNEMGTLTAGWSAIPTTIYQSEAAFATAAANHQISTPWVVYDTEDWPATPANEQQDPATYMKNFVYVAHQYLPHPLHVILAPANDLVRSMSCYVSSDPIWKNYLSGCKLPVLAARAHPDVFEIQAQGYENDTSGGTGCGCYAWFVRQAAADARAVRGETGLTVLAGLATDPSGNVSTGLNLYTDSASTRQVVQGYWLNVAKQSTACPKCTTSGDPQVAVNYLHRLGYSG